MKNITLHLAHITGRSIVSGESFKQAYLTLDVKALEELLSNYTTQSVLGAVMRVEYVESMIIRAVKDKALHALCRTLFSNRKEFLFQNGIVFEGHPDKRSIKGWLNSQLKDYIPDTPLMQFLHKEHRATAYHEGLLTFEIQGTSTEVSPAYGVRVNQFTETAKEINSEILTGKVSVKHGEGVTYTTTTDREVVAYTYFNVKGNLIRTVVV